MKKQSLLSLILAIFLTFSAFPAALADRAVDAWECSSAHEFLSRVEVGTVVDFDATLDTVFDKYIKTTPAIKGCDMAVAAYFPKSCRPADFIRGKLYHVHGTVSELGHNNPIVFYMSDDTVISESRIQSNLITLNNADLYLDKVTIYDTFTGSGAVLKTYDSGSTHSVLMRSGSTRLYFKTDAKEFFKGDIIEFSGILDFYDSDIQAYHITFTDCHIR